MIADIRWLVHGLEKCNFERRIMLHCSEHAELWHAVAETDLCCNLVRDNQTQTEVHYRCQLQKKE